MAQVKLEIGGRTFMVTCQDGEEDHLGKLGAMVDAKAGEAGDPAGLTESRMLLFTSLLLADELHSAKTATANIPTPQPAIPPTAKAQKTKDAEDERVLIALEKLADRAEAFANGLEQDSNRP